MLRAQTSSAEASFPFCKEEVDALRYVVFSRALAAPRYSREHDEQSPSEPLPFASPRLSVSVTLSAETLVSTRLGLSGVMSQVSTDGWPPSTGSPCPRGAGILSGCPWGPAFLPAP